MFVTNPNWLTELLNGICLFSDGVIGIGITATAFGAVGLIAGGIVAAMSRKKWKPQPWLLLCVYNGSLLFFTFFSSSLSVFSTAYFTIYDIEKSKLFASN